MEHLSIYGEAPDFLARIAESAPMRRLRDVGMNCGCEYTAFPRFRGIGRYTRFEHSLGAAMIVWHFTHDEKQAVSALLHDVATPVFAHVVDFMRGDHLTQTATESGTAGIIRGSGEICAALASLGLTAAEVEDYHIYPVADNPTPRLSADRLEYTCGNAINFSFAAPGEIAELYSDLTVGENETGESELMFRTPERALRFARIALRCSRLYVCDEDRYAMQRLSELLRDAAAARVVSEEQLLGTESAVISDLLSDGEFSARWRSFCAMSRTERAGSPGRDGEWRRIRAKKRYIDPYIVSHGRTGELFAEHGAELAAFLKEDQGYYVRGE